MVQADKKWGKTRKNEEKRGPETFGILQEGASQLKNDEKSTVAGANLRDRWCQPRAANELFFRFHWLGVIRRMFFLYIGEIHIQTRQAIGILIVKKCWNGSGHKHFQRFCIFHWRNFNGVMFVFHRGKNHIPVTPSHWDFIFQCRYQPLGCFLHYIIYRDGTSLCCRLLPPRPPPSKIACLYSTIACCSAVEKVL